MKKLITFILFINILIIVNGQPADKKWGLGVFVGKTEYNGDLGNGFLQFKQEFYNFGGASLSYYINKSFDITAQGTFGNYGYSKNTLLNFKGRKADGNLLLTYKLNNDFVFKANSKLAPYLLAGVGMSNVWNIPHLVNRINGGYDLTYSGGIGLKYHFSDWIALQYQTLYTFTNGDNRDFIAANKNDGYLAHSLGLVFSFGTPRDTDKDGIPNKLDKCPNTPANVKVDAAGCPIDTDKDGIADYFDKCPTTKGLAIFRGCPDTDGDGIEDSEDKCPTVKGVLAFQGCPDTDGDGIQDSEDKCPTWIGIAALHGCPDTDGDGITDFEDRCPYLFGVKENFGCPEVVAKEASKPIKLLLEKALRGIQFETYKSIIKEVSFPILDEFVTLMNKHKEAKLIVNGHTDNVGTDESNLSLSRKRAAAIKTYLEEHGIDGERITTEGFGESQPIADNKTPEGRALNRRVQFILVF